MSAVGLYPLKFIPLFKERVWGGRELEALYHKQLPQGVPIGESWELVDRPQDISTIQNGPLQGKSLRFLMESSGSAMLGADLQDHARFPWLVKLLDSREKLSLQVHPPASRAASLGGEPKTEMWFVAKADPGAALFVGLKHGVTRAQFEARTRDGSVAECFHRIPVTAGDAMFLPSGRVHAIGSGLVIFEVQQNSDTTYRVFDWNRVGLDGKPRPLHIAESMASIDFDDFEPSLIPRRYRQEGSFDIRSLVEHDLFRIDELRFGEETDIPLSSGLLELFGVVHGRLSSTHPLDACVAEAGQFLLKPAGTQQARIQAAAGSVLLRVQPGRRSS